MLLPFLLLALNGLAGAVVAKNVRELTIPVWVSFLPSIVSASIWAWMARKGTMPLIMTSLLYDIIYLSAYTVGLLMVGERLTFAQSIGFMLCFAGIILINGR